MNLGQLKQVIDKALEQRPELADKSIRYVNDKYTMPIDGLVYTDKEQLELRAFDTINKELIWLP